MQSIDDTDRRILRQYQAQPALSTAELAARAGVTQATCWRRLERLERAGVIVGVEAVIDWRALDYAVEVSLRVTLDKTVRGAFDAFLAAARELPEVSEIQTFLGRTDVRLNVLARDMAHYQEIYRDRILALPHMADIEALMLVANVHETEALPL
ncbi:AsnC family transcriptional regulator [Maritimibacter sp. 55A14]|uniref:Lrp/AsnC family transcriptional regulator n=1 Tax=Maritimibacter sp. 55A14 TaxID=2174844 RepID=UPI000D60E536|nr:Lrp/AsnC family transcriptional regulator [Maritimibacter sp. 55A14]PWE33665.1 AsnC family transcriptional regulator [Maritimibacter sp. 55A14]